MQKPNGYNTSHATIDYGDFYEAHKEDILQSAVDAISPDVMGMDRDQALTLAGAMKNCGFSREDFAAVMSRSSADKGTFAKQWDRFRGSGRHGEATEGTIIDYAKKCGWKWPAPDPNEARQMPPKKQAPQLLEYMAKYTDSFKLSCIFDSEEYTSKPANVWEIRNREKVPTPAPDPISLQDFARAVTKGHTFSPTVYSKEQTGADGNGKPIYKYKAISQQLFVVDIDNEEITKDAEGKQIKRRIENPLTIEEALDKCRQKQIAPFFVYETFSSKDHREDAEEPYAKFRLCFAMDKPLTVQEYGERGISKAINYFISLFGKAADTKTTDAARLIYGTDEKESARLSGNIINSRKFMEMLLAGKMDQEAEDTAEGEKVISPSEEVDAFLDTILTERYAPLPTGINDIDNVLGGGFIRQQLIFVNAAPGMGKSTLCQQIAEEMAKRGNIAIYFNLEMSKEQMLARSLARISGSDLDALQILQAYKLPEEKLEDIRDAAKCYKEYIGDSIEYNPQYYDAEIGDYRNCNAELDSILLSMKQAAIKAQKEERPAPIIFIDYLHLLRGSDREDAASVIKRAVEQFKDYAVQYKTVVVVISANNRTANKQGKGAIDAGRDTSAIEYSGDVMLSLNYKASDQKDGKTAEEITEEIQKYRERGQEVPQEYRLFSLRITKSRLTEANKRAVLEFDGKHSKFKQVTFRPTFNGSKNGKEDPAEEVSSATLKARSRREKKRIDYINAYRTIRDSGEDVTIQRLADYLGVSQATVKTNIKDLLPGLFSFDDILQDTKNYIISMVLDLDEKEEGFQPLTPEQEEVFKDADIEE